MTPGIAIHVGCVGPICHQQTFSLGGQHCAATVLPTNEEIWNSTEATTHFTTEATTAATDATESTGSVNETEVQNHVNAHTEMMDKIRENENAGKSTEGNGNSRASRMMPGTR